MKLIHLSAAILAAPLLLTPGAARAVTLPVALDPQVQNNWCWAASGEMVMTYLGATTAGVDGASQCQQANVELKAAHDSCARDSECGDAGSTGPCMGEVRGTCSNDASQGCSSDSDCGMGNSCAGLVTGSCTLPIVAESVDCCANPTPAGCDHGGGTQFSHYNFATTNYWVNGSGTLPFASLKGEIDSNRPVEFAWSWNGGGGHVMVVVGYEDNANGQWVGVNNPWPPNVGDYQLLTYSAYDSLAGPGGYTHQSDTYGITDDQLCFPDFHGMPLANFSACATYWAQRGRFPTTLTGYVTGSDDLMAGSFVPSDDRPYAAMLLPGDYQTLFDAQLANGFRPNQVGVAATADGYRITATFVPTEGAFWSFTGMTEDDFKVKDSTYTGQGYELVDFSAFQAGVDTNYNATWVLRPNTGYYFYYNMTAADVSSFDTQFSPWQPVHLNAYMTSQGERFAAIWKPVTNSSYAIYWDLTAPDYQTTYNTLESTGYRLREVTVNDSLFAAIWAQ